MGNLWPEGKGVYIKQIPLAHVITYTCNTFRPKIKGKGQCINVVLHWLWNVNEIYAHLNVRISRYCTLTCVYIKLKYSTNPSKGFDAGSETTTTYIQAQWQYQLWD